MNSILNYIENIPYDRIAYITKSNSYKFGDIKNLYILNKPTINKLHDSCVVINARSREEFILLLSILDGNVKRIVFLPKDIDEDILGKYYSESNAKYEVYLEGPELKLKEINLSTKLDSINETQWVIPTSGTTNNPKLVAHTFSSLTRTTKGNIELGSKYKWGLTFDIYRFSGIQVFLQALFGGSSLIIPESTYSMQKIIDLFVENDANIISATPSFWRKVLMMKNLEKLKLKRATLGGEISDESILLALKKSFKDIKLTHIYASTEVGVGFAVTDGHSGFPYSYVKNGIVNIRMKIDENSLLWINPGKVNQNYIARDSMYDSEGYINTGDLVKVDNDRVYFLGRESGSINVGGNKVQPEEVEAKLLSSGLVSCAFVYAKKNPILGSLVYADIVLLDDCEDKDKLKKDLISYCRENMENFKVPAGLKIVDDLNITDSGKIKRG